MTTLKAAANTFPHGDSATSRQTRHLLIRRRPGNTEWIMRRAGGGGARIAACGCFIGCASGRRHVRSRNGSEATQLRLAVDGVRLAEGCLGPALGGFADWRQQQVGK